MSADKHKRRLAVAMILSFLMFIAATSILIAIIMVSIWRVVFSTIALYLLLHAFKEHLYEGTPLREDE